jgi:phosphoribosylamine-glycine ligase
MIVLLPKQWKKVVLLETLQPPFVLKADGLAAGKGVDYSGFGRSKKN